MSIDWSNPKCMISKHFSVHEATYLPQWNLHYSPSEEEQSEIVKLAEILDVVREFLDKPMNVHVWIRPTVDGKGDYNALVGGASHSAHKYGKAADFDVEGMTAQDVRDSIRDKLEEWGLRCEDQVSWVHLDTQEVPPGGHRIFKA